MKDWGLCIGRFSVVWYDCWTRQYGCEVAWGNRVLFLAGFKGVR